MLMAIFRWLMTELGDDRVTTVYRMELNNVEYDSMSP